MANPGKLIHKFLRNLSFPGCDTDGFLENSSSIFSKFQFPWHELDRFLENSSNNFLLLADPRKLIPKFSEISVFRGMSWTDFWKIHPSIFCEYLFSFCKISGHDSCGMNLTDFWKTRLIWMSFPEFGLCHAFKF